MPSRYSITRDAIDEAIAHSTNLKTFDYILTQMGYEHCLSDSRKYWTIVPKGYKKPIRLKSLGENYTEDAIKRRLTENQKVLIVPFAKETVRVRQYRLPTREHKIKKVGGLYGLYLHYCYKLGYLPKYKKQNTARLAVFKTVVYTNSPDSFKYYQFVNAETAEDFTAYVEKCKKLSLYETGVTAEYGDKLLTLSTCEYSQTNGRLVVVAKLINE